MTASAADQSHSEREKSAADGAQAEKKKMTVSERDIGALTRGLQDWLAGRSAGPGRPTVTGARTPEANGLSSTSVLFEVCWSGEGRERRGSYVARLAPEASAMPVFPRYDLPTSLR